MPLVPIDSSQRSSIECKRDKPIGVATYWRDVTFVVVSRYLDKDFYSLTTQKKMVAEEKYQIFDD